MAAKASRSMVPSTKGHMTSMATSAYDIDANRPMASGSSVGHDAGTYRPPSTASPASRTSAKSSSGAAPRVLT